MIYLDDCDLKKEEKSSCPVFFKFKRNKSDQLFQSNAKSYENKSKMDMIFTFLLAAIIMAIAICVGMMLQCALQYYCRYILLRAEDDEVRYLIGDKQHDVEAGYQRI